MFYLNSRENRKGHGLFFDAEREFFSIPVHPPARVYPQSSLTEACRLVNRSDRASSKYHEVARPLFFRAQDICAYPGR